MKKAALVCSPAEAERIAHAHLLIGEAYTYLTGAGLSSPADADCVITVGILPDGTAPEADGYVILSRTADGKTEVYVAYSGRYAMLCAIDRFVKTYITPDGVQVPPGLRLCGRCAEADAVITSRIPRLRDPFVLKAADGTYYAYGTGWQYWKNTSGRPCGAWEGPFDCVIAPADVSADRWAPEVHACRGAYYMFTTYRSAESGRHGCTILRADNPEGPFTEITGGHITPAAWDAIDGTLYVDTDGTPYMVFVHEWISLPDHVGSFAAVELKPDLSGAVGQPFELFRADDPSWARLGVTDGCFLRRTADGRLLMIWSNWDAHGYCVGLAQSDNGRLTGRWIQNDRLLFSKTAFGTYDGGHGMLFTDADGQLYLSLHSPNDQRAGRPETPVFIPVREAYGTLACDLWHEES